jgi:hypothetical protein
MKKPLVVLAVFLSILALPAVAFPASMLTGTFKALIGAGPLGGGIKGTWTIKFASGAYTVTRNGTAVIHGKYASSGDKLTLRDETGPDSCPATGTYTFKLTGTKMKFTPVSDSTADCEGRVAVLSASFTKIA